MKILVKIFEIFVILSLASCITIQSTPAYDNPTVREFTGRILVKKNGKGISQSGIHLIGYHNSDIEILLTTPLGQTAAQIYNKSAGTTVKLADGRVFHHENDITLTKELLGYPLPIRYLANWFFDYLYSNSNALKLDNWVISFHKTGESELPKQIILEQQNTLFLNEEKQLLEITIIIDKWIVV